MLHVTPMGDSSPSLARAGNPDKVRDTFGNISTYWLLNERLFTHHQ